MYPYIQIILPSYTVMALIGGFVALCFIYLRLDKFNIEFSVFLSTFLCCVLGCFIGSKVLFAVTQIPWLISDFSIQNLLLLIPQSGFVFYGGLFGVILTIKILTKANASLRDRLFKMVAPSMPLFHAFGRVGCFLSGCCYGKKLANTIGIGPLVFTRIPVQLMESAAELVIFILLLIIERKNKSADLLQIYLMMYAVVRFLDEFLRGDEIRGIVLGVSTAQWISLFIVIFYVIRSIIQKKNMNMERRIII